MCGCSRVLQVLRNTYTNTVKTQNNSIISPNPPYHLECSKLTLMLNPGNHLSVVFPLVLPWQECHIMLSNGIQLLSMISFTQLNVLKIHQPFSGITYTSSLSFYIFVKLCCVSISIIHNPPVFLLALWYFPFSLLCKILFLQTSV